jgi:hypothetical protein
MTDAVPATTPSARATASGTSPSRPLLITMSVTGYAGFRQGKRPRSQISVGYPSFKKEGAVSWAGNIRPVSLETNCHRDKTDPVARDRHQESHRAIDIGGVGVRERGILRSAHGTRRAIVMMWSVAASGRRLLP